MSAGQPNILHICATDRHGGAALAARRLVAAQCAAGMHARMLVVSKLGDDDFVEQIEGSFVRQRVRAARFLAKRYAAMAAHDHPAAMRSLALLPSGIGREVARRKPDIVQWHWVGGEAIGLQDLLATSHIPSIWTCRDHWIGLGAEHFSTSGDARIGYRSRGAFDPDRWTFARKQRAYRHWNPQLVSLTRSGIDELREYPLLKNRPIEAIPNVGDFTNLFPADRHEARSKLGIDGDRPVLLFGAQGGISDQRKGFAFLEQALLNMPAAIRENLTLMTFGGKEKSRSQLAGLQTLELGYLESAEQLRTAFSAASVFANPSLAETFGNTNVEALACGTPVVAFATGNAPDLLGDPAMGQFVDVGDQASFAAAVLAQLEAKDSDDLRNARNNLVKNAYDEGLVIRAYRALYARILQKEAA